MDQVDAAKELIKSGQSASEGDWIPLTIIVISFGIILTLAGIIIKMAVAKQEKRIGDVEEAQNEDSNTLVKMGENLVELKGITTRMDIILENYNLEIKRNEKSIEKNTDRINDILK